MIDELEELDEVEDVDDMDPPDPKGWHVAPRSPVLLKESAS